MENEQSQESSANASIAGCLIPAFWMLGGNGIIAVCAVAIACDDTAALGFADALYWLTAACLIGARYADIRYLGGRTAEGAPATMTHWQRYALIVLVVSTVMWITVHLIPGIGL